MTAEIKPMVERLNSLFAYYLGVNTPVPPDVFMQDGFAKAEWQFPEFEARLDINLESGESSVVLAKPGMPGQFDLLVDFEDEEDMAMLESEFGTLLADLDPFAYTTEI